MPTTKPRITITMEPPVGAAIARLANLTGRPKAALLSELLNEALPAIANLVRSIEQAQRADEHTKARFVESVRDLAESAEATFDLFERVTSDHATARAGGEGRAAGTASPPPSTGRKGTPGLLHGGKPPRTPHPVRPRTASKPSRRPSRSRH